MRKKKYNSKASPEHDVSLTEQQTLWSRKPSSSPIEGVVVNISYFPAGIAFCWLGRTFSMFSHSGYTQIHGGGIDLKRKQRKNILPVKSVISHIALQYITLRF